MKMAHPISPLLLVGPTGMLGRAWRELLNSRGVAWSGVARPDLDLTHRDRVERAIRDGVRAVVNCAGWTAVDAAEADEAGATAVNGVGVGHLAARCKEVGATLVHYSTDYVFDGTATTPYRTDASRNPIGAYGRSKAAGEAAIEATGCEHLTVRTSWLYAPWGKNFVRTMAKLTREKPELKVVADQHGRPTSSEHLARVTLDLLERGARGTFHVTDGGECTWHEFARAVADGLGHRRCVIHPCSTTDYPTPARRPAYSVLDLTPTEAILGPMPCWRDNLADVLRRLE